MLGEKSNLGIFLIGKPYFAWLLWYCSVYVRGSQEISETYQGSHQDTFIDMGRNKGNKKN